MTETGAPAHDAVVALDDLYAAENESHLVRGYD